jgi:N-acetylglucosamine-6-phosphate deacetylase
VALIQEAKALKHPNFAGLHLEGPFISHEFKGAHDPKVLHAPTDAELARIIEASDGLVKSMTVAPELISDSQLQSLQEAGIGVCFGHSAAGYEQARAFFAKGSKIMTHAFNGMAGIHHRAPGPVPAALESDAFTELIADGVHVQPAAARLLNQEKVILVTDAMAATGMPDGDYNLGTMAVKVTKGVARTESGSIAGSTLLLKDAVRTYAEWTGSPVSALRAAITNPAIAYGVDAPTLSRGSKSWLLWNGRLEIQD